MQTLHQTQPTVKPMTAPTGKRERKLARRQEASAAIRLYAIDNAAARRGERAYPSMRDYTQYTTVDGPRELEATEYARGRFGELPAKRGGN